MKKTFISMAIAALVVNVSGCTQIQAIDKAAGDLAKSIQLRRGQGPKGNVSIPANTSTPCGERRETVVRLSSTDVDTAFVRLKRHFRYRTLEERIEASPWKKRAWIDEGFRYEATPGARYWMKDSVDIKIGSETQRGWLSTEVERNGAGAIVRLGFCVGGSDGFVGGPGFTDMLSSRVRDVAEGRRE